MVFLPTPSLLVRVLSARVIEIQELAGEVALVSAPPPGGEGREAVVPGRKDPPSRPEERRRGETKQPRALFSSTVALAAKDEGRRRQEEEEEEEWVTAAELRLAFYEAADGEGDELRAVIDGEDDDDEGVSYRGMT